VFDVPTRCEWDVTVSGRIENVTDHEEFPGLFRAALHNEKEISIVRFDEPTSPHATLVTIRILANDRKDAERASRDLVLRVYLTIARQLAGDGDFGWTLRTRAVPSVIEPQPNWRRRLSRIFRHDWR
jgi:hypothetical protein